MSNEPIHILGGGLAGSEAAWQAAEAGAKVILHEMRGVKRTDAHETDAFAELVCSNSFRSDDHEQNAVGLLHEEMRRCNSLIMRAADQHKLPAGGALAVDRHGFSGAVTEAISNHPNITVVREEIAGWPPGEWQHVVIATGPLTSPALAEAVLEKTGEDSLAFFDAIAPIVHYDSINHDIAWKQSRYDKAGPGGTGADYLNLPMDKDQYFAFVEALKTAPLHEFKDWEKVPYFDGCLPIEVMAERAQVTNHCLGHAQMPRGIARFDRFACVEDHGGELQQGGRGLASVAFKTLKIGHWIVVEIEAARPKQALERAHRQAVPFNRIEQGVGQRVLTDGAMAIVGQSVVPPLQADFAWLWAGYPFTDSRYIGVESIERGDTRARCGRKDECRKIAVRIARPQGLGRKVKALAGHYRAFSTAINAAATARSSARSTL